MFTELRLAELSPVVSHFLILESKTTFTGLSKPLVLAPYLTNQTQDARFHQYLPQIRYQAIDGRSRLPGEDPFHLEKEMRQSMNTWLQNSAESGVRQGDLVIMSDVVSPARVPLECILFLRIVLMSLT